MGKAIALLGEGDSCLAGLARNIFVPVQQNLRRKRRMTAYFDGHVSPLRVQNMKRVVVDIRHRLLSLDVVIGVDIPHRRLCPADEAKKQSLRDGGLGEIFLGDAVLALSRRTVDDRNVVGLGVTANAPTKAASQTHDMSVV